jgi:hypothetical protein
LPVVDDVGALVGIVDVLKLTYATLEQVGYLLILAAATKKRADGVGIHRSTPFTPILLEPIPLEDLSGEDSSQPLPMREETTIRNR